jgi:hypothetical protein
MFAERFVSHTTTSPVRDVVVAKNGDKTKRRTDVESYIFSSIEVLRMRLASKRTTVVAVEDMLKEWY